MAATDSIRADGANAVAVVRADSLRCMHRYVYYVSYGGWAQAGNPCYRAYLLSTR